MDANGNRSSGERHGSAVGAAVEAALREDRLLFAFQPVVCAATGKVDYFECLLRMRDEEGVLVSGAEFITIAEELGWIGLIDRYVLRKTVQELAADPEVRLGLNISGITVCDRPWLRSLTSLLRHRRDIACRLVVEITETAALGEVAASARFVDTLRQAGCALRLTILVPVIPRCAIFRCCRSTSSKSMARWFGISRTGRKPGFFSATCSVSSTG